MTAPKKYSHESVKLAVAAARTVDRSQGAHHTALMNLLFHAQASDIPLTVLSEYMTNRVQESPNSLCTKATGAWLSQHFGLRVMDTGEVKRGRDFTKKGFNKQTFEAARVQPWFELAKDMAFKVPAKINMSATASTAAKLEYTGEALPSKDELYQMFLDSIKEVKKGQGYHDWVRKYDEAKAKGELPAAA